jgi:hypothetical protein
MQYKDRDPKCFGFGQSLYFKLETDGDYLNADAVIPPRKNAKLWKADTPGARARNEAVRSSKYLGRALWRRLTGYHRRSRVETKMHCLKLLGQRLSARDFDRQVAEIQIRAAILNGFTALGIPKTVATE